MLRQRRRHLECHRLCSVTAIALLLWSVSRVVFHVVNLPVPMQSSAFQPLAMESNNFLHGFQLPSCYTYHNIRSLFYSDIIWINMLFCHLINMASGSYILAKLNYLLLFRIFFFIEINMYLLIWLYWISLKLLMLFHTDVCWGSSACMAGLELPPGMPGISTALVGCIPGSVVGKAVAAGDAVCPWLCH